MDISLFSFNPDCLLEQRLIERQGKFLMSTIRNPIDFIGFALPMDNLGLILMRSFFTVVGVLSEVTVMFLVVHAVNSSRFWYDWG